MVLTLFDKEDSDLNRYYQYFSSYKNNTRMLACMYRFCRNSKNEEKMSSSDISVDEFEKAEKILHRLIQKESFSGITDPKIRTLRRLEGKNGLLRAKSNIQMNDKENFRYSMILHFAPSCRPKINI